MAEGLPREVRALVAAGFLVSIGYGFVAPAIPLYARGFGISYVAASAVVSVFAVMRLLGAAPAGRVVNRLGERDSYVLGLLVITVSTGACAFAAQYWQLVLLRAVSGLGSALFTVAGGVLLARTAPPRLRGRASGVYSTFFVLGGISGPLLGGGLIAVDLRTPFLVYGAALLLAAVLMLAVVRRPQAPAPGVGAPAEQVAGFVETLRHPAYRAALAANFANGWMVAGVRISLVPLFVVDGLGRGGSWAGTSLAAFAAGNAVVLFGAGEWSDRRGRKPPVVLGLLLAGVSTGVMGLTEQFSVFAAVSFTAGLGSGMLTPPLNAAVADVLGARGRGGPVLAGFQMAADLGSVVGPLAAGALASGFSFAVAFAVTGLWALLSVPLWLRAPETLPPADPPGPADQADSAARSSSSSRSRVSQGRA
ncbi:MFS transporter [Kitasatospora sp. NPDC057015]|uniref:MFS transporter n=1 Tax=Kitasatospora sp. NPDC057015 TaxID=3346001 RepID=UPI003641EC38